MTAITIEQATEVVDAGLRRARELGLKPLTIAVLDPGGHLVVLKREDRSGILRPEIAYGKAWGALGMGHGTRFLAQRVEKAPAFFTALASASQGRMIPVPGGVLVRNAQGDVLGAVGISGDLPDNDEACAVHGIEAIHLVADPGLPH
ncbi:MAG: heme-binding protein [Burkholderiales bacterium]|nr:heme-binding protein [Burkholderiales bacterium]